MFVDSKEGLIRGQVMVMNKYKSKTKNMILMEYTLKQLLFHGLFSFSIYFEVDYTCL